VISLDLARPALLRANGSTLICEPIPSFLMDMVKVGGLMNLLRRNYCRRI
jgi:3-isopropylmalate/(R)-2-methylmalate dehydratase small subunit